MDPNYPYSSDLSNQCIQGADQSYGEWKIKYQAQLSNQISRPSSYTPSFSYQPISNQINTNYQNQDKNLNHQLDLPYSVGSGQNSQCDNLTQNEIKALSIYKKQIEEFQKQQLQFLTQLQQAQHLWSQTLHQSPQISHTTILPRRVPVVTGVISQTQIISSNANGSQNKTWQSYKKRLIRNQLSNLKCMICLSEEVNILCPCHHLFHSQCLESWLKKHTTCPVCKQKINKNQMVPINQNQCKNL